MILNMQAALAGLTRPLVLRMVTTTTIDFVETESVSDAPIVASVTPPTAETLRTAGLDSSLEYKRFVSPSDLIPVDSVVIDGAKQYRVVRSSDWLSDYGFCDAIGEVIK